MSTEFIMTLYVFCSDYHTGQWSRGYRILSKISKMGIRLTDTDFKEFRESDTYHLLVQNYASKL